jgi:restriction endonuclease S subunit
MLPKDWKLMPLAEVTDLITKGSSPTWQGLKYVDQGIQFITSENVGDGHLLLDGKTKYLEARFNDIQPRSILRKGDVLTNLVGASIGRTAIYDLEDGANINQAVAVIRPTPKLLNSFLVLLMNSPTVVAWMHQEKVDVARANLSLTQLNRLMIPVPPLHEQEAIVNSCSSKLTQLDELKVKVAHSLGIIARVSDSILSKAFSGSLVDQDPTDEPASSLLERIKASATPKSAPKKRKAEKEEQSLSA